MNQHLMNAMKLSNLQLHNLLVNRTSSEREILAEIVSYISEVDRRKMYLDFNCTSLFAYLVKEMKYSNASAQRRIDAARLLNAVPEMKSDLETGEINLSQVSVVSQGLKQARKEAKVDLRQGKRDKSEVIQLKRDLIEKVKAQPVGEAQKLVAQTLNLQIQTQDKKVVQRDESVRLEITLSKEEADLLKEVKDLLSHSNPGASAKEILVAGLRELKKKKDPTSKGLRGQSKVRRSDTSAAEVTARQLPTKNPSAAARNLVFTKHNCCQWEFSNGQVCGSTFQLQIDHIKAKWLGGTNAIENYQVLCSAHNRLKYRNEIGLN